MNDRFKFRVWYMPEYDKPRMIYGAEKTYDYMYGEPEIICADCFGSLLDSKEYILMQCTGLKDKNGKLIYEGDIVKDDHDAWHYVKWVYDSWQLFPCTQNNYTIGIVDDEIEVIGNIYENKELLEDTECQK